MGRKTGPFPSSGHNRLPANCSDQAKNLALKIQEFMGINILVDIQRRPGWKDSLEASKERMACRYDRCHL